MKKICITGSSGFIGSHLVRRLVAAGYDVLGIDRRAPETDSALFTFRQCDILDRAQVDQILGEWRPDAVVHLAARTDLDETQDIAGYAANIEGVENLLIAIANTPSVCRGIFTSSQLVCRVGYIPRHDQDYSPNTLYGQSKILTEKLVRQHDGGGVEWCLVRPTTVWGPGMGPHYQRFVRLIARNLYWHIGGVPAYQPYGYVGNVVHQYLKLLEAPAYSIHRQTFYLADYTPLSIRQWVDAFQQEMQTAPVGTLPELVAMIAAKAGDLLAWFGISFPLTSFRLKNLTMNYQFDLEPTKRVCGPLPYKMEQGVRETVAWLQAAAVLPERDGFHQRMDGQAPAE